jgi:hypothetical protein
MHRTADMPIDNAHAFFEAVAAHEREPRLSDATGTWEFDVEGAGTWTISTDHGVLRVDQGPLDAAAGRKPRTRLRLKEDELVRLARGEGHENLLTALLRGALAVEGELAFAQRLQVILPVPEDWRVSP